VASIAAGVLVWAATLRDSGERRFTEVERYSAELGDFVSRDLREFEAFVFLGWLVPLAAVAGLIVLARERPRLAAALGMGALVPALLALGANLPGYRTLWQHTPLMSTRVPERLMPIACLALAALVAFAVARVPWRLTAVVAAALVAFDLRAGVELYDPLVAGGRNTVYAAVGATPRGRLLEVPALPPDAYASSVYLLGAMTAERERPLGYGTAAPPEAERVARRLAAIGCRGAVTALSAELRRLGVTAVVHHRALDGRPEARRTCPQRTKRMLRAAGFRTVVTGNRLELLARRSP
jgi:hypothetical protein